MHLTTQVANLLDLRFRDYLHTAMAKHPSMFNRWCDIETATSKTMYQSGISELPRPASVGEGAELSEAERVEGPTQSWTAGKYGYRVLVSRELLEDEDFPVFKETAQAVGSAMFHLLEAEGIEDINNAFTTANSPGGTGSDEYLCQQTHVAWEGTSGSSQNNAPASAVTLGLDAFWDAYNTMVALKNTQGDPALKIPRYLMVPFALRRKSSEILNSQDVPFYASNETNAIRELGIERIDMPYASSTTAWFLKTADNPIRWYWKRQVDIEQEKLMSRDSMAWQVTVRFSHKPSLMGWMEIYGSAGTA